MSAKSSHFHLHSQILSLQYVQALALRVLIIFQASSSFLVNMYHLVSSLALCLNFTFLTSIIFSYHHML